MSSLMLAASQALSEMELEFPNLFGGTAMSYRRGFNVFGITIYWYGVIIAVGVVLAYFYAMRRVTRDFGIVKDRAFDVVFVTIIGGFLFARIYYCAFTELKNPGSYTIVTVFTHIRDGGIAMYGGIIGAVIVGSVMCRLRKVKFLAMTDLSAMGFLIGQTIGRWGNFVNQEAYGAECSPDWLFAMTGSRIRSEMGEGAFVHPCFLYESCWCLLGFIFLHFYSKRLRTFDGEISLLYIAWYGFGRFFIEQLRTDSLYWGPFKVSQWLGAVSFTAAAVCFVIFKIRTKKSGKPLYVNTEASKELIELDRKAEEERLAKKEKKAQTITERDNITEETEVTEKTEEETIEDKETENGSKDN